MSVIILSVLHEVMRLRKGAFNVWSYTQHVMRTRKGSGDAEAVEYVPASPPLQADCAAAEYWPGAHGKQSDSAVLPVALCCFPAVQAWHRAPSMELW